MFKWKSYGNFDHICDALQQNREQVAQVYFEI